MMTKPDPVCNLISEFCDPGPRAQDDAPTPFLYSLHSEILELSCNAAGDISLTFAYTISQAGAAVCSAVTYGDLTWSSTTVYWK